MKNEIETKSIEFDLNNSKDNLLLFLVENRHLLDNSDISNLRTVRTKLKAVVNEDELNTKFGDKTLEIAYNLYIESLTEKIQLLQLNKNLFNYFSSKELKTSMFSAEELLGIIRNDANNLSNQCDGFIELIDSIKERFE